MSDLDKAREWANRGEHLVGVIHPDVKAAMKIIQSLPDNWVDVEKVRKILDIFIRESDSPANPGNVSRVYRECAETLEHLLPPKLPTLADMTAEERAACQWMQCNVEGRGDDTFVIAVVGEQFNKVLRPDGLHEVKGNNQVTPRPDLPRLEWPGSHADTITAESVEDVQAGRVADFEPALPRPEDVPDDELWLVECGGSQWLAQRIRDWSKEFAWRLTSMTRGSRMARDSEIILIHKLVPETHTLPEGMRLADHEEYGRVVVSPRTDDMGDHSIYVTDGEVATHAYEDWAKPNELTFLDGAE